MSTAEAEARPIRSLIPARLDRLSWSRFHTRMVAGLGGAWILDGLQITIASSVTGELTQPTTLGMTSTQVVLIASIYLVGEMVGARLFGRRSVRLSRKRLFIYTLLLYLLGTGLAAFVTGNHTGWLPRWPLAPVDESKAIELGSGKAVRLPGVPAPGVPPVPLVPQACDPRGPR